MLHNNQAAFSNRDYRWIGVPSEVAGFMFTRKAGSIAADITVTIPSSVASPQIYAGVCPQQAGHNSSLLLPSDGWVTTKLTFMYLDRTVQLYQWKPTAAAAVLSAEGGASFSVAADKTFCGTIVAFAAGSSATE